VTMTPRVALIAGFVLLPALGQGKDLKLASAWASGPVKVDGTADAWSALLKPLGDEPMVIGVQNDADFLYLCVKTSDLKTRKQLGTVGLTVWANGEGKDKRAFGVRFPAREKPHEGRSGAGPQGKWPGDAPHGAPPEDDQAPPMTEEGGRTREADKRPAELELIGPTESDRLLVRPGGDERAAAAQGDDSGVMVLEFRIPLKATDAHPLAIGASSGAIIAIGLETERPKKSLSLGEPGSGSSGGEGPPGGAHGGPGGGLGTGRGGMGGGYGGGRHGMGGGSHEGGREYWDPIKIWLQVALAASPTPVPTPAK
jgi:hypothetical protein